MNLIPAANLRIIRLFDDLSGHPANEKRLLRFAKYEL
jgi:hypothetical protein